MTIETFNIHRSRRCANCEHLLAEDDDLCLQAVGMADGSRRPVDFACHEHQTPGEYRLGLHRSKYIVLGVV